MNFISINNIYNKNNDLFAYINYKSSKNYRKRKGYIRDMFNWWYMEPNTDDKYQEYWKMKLQDGTYVRMFLMNNCKALHNNQFGKMLQLMDFHKKLNCPTDK